MLKIAICDDCAEDCRALSGCVSRVLAGKSCEIRVFTDPAKLLADSDAAALDVVFLDIQMGDENGIAVARLINKSLPRAEIIYTTAYLAYAVDIYETRYAYFLVKPILEEKLTHALNHAVDRLAKSCEDFITIPLHGKKRQAFQISDILYCERRGRETAVVLSDAEYATRLRISDIEQYVPERQFARPHNSFLVNLRHVHEITHDSVMLDGGAILPVSNQKRAAFTEALMKYL